MLLVFIHSSFFVLLPVIHRDENDLSRVDHDRRDTTVFSYCTLEPCYITMLCPPLFDRA